MSNEDRIIIASAHLPIEVDRTTDGSFTIHMIDENLIYSILYSMKEKEICEIVWVGMLRNFTEYNEEELKSIEELLNDNNMYMIPVTQTEYNDYWTYMNSIMIPAFVDNSIDMKK